MEAILDLLFAALSTGGPSQKRKAAVRPYYYAFVVTASVFVVWMAVG
ncbi:hypothetical protein [Pedobacter sp. SYSU D00535]|nr:hypothetical protein [Pedobacter sp. SYSU D00535]